MTYLVMEAHKSYCVVLDEEGRFLKAANMGYEAGQTIGKIIKMPEYEEKKIIPFKAIAATLSLAACLILVITTLFNQLPPIHGSVYLTINPEIRADVSKDGTVVSLAPLNEDAATLLEGYNGKKKPLTTVANDLVDRAISLGFLSEGGAVVIDIDSPDDQWFRETGITLRQNLNDHAEEGMFLTIEIKQYMQQVASPPPEASPAKQTPSAPPSKEPTPTKPPEPANKYITGEQALAAALRHAGVEASDVREIEIEFEEDDGIMQYEVSFYAGNAEYEYEIDAITSKVLKAEKDIDDDDDD